MPDLHNHTPMCHHAEGEPEEYIARAHQLGIAEYGFSEHSPWMFQYEGEPLAPTGGEFPLYLEKMEHLRARERRNGGLNLRIGIEMDFIPEKRAEAEAAAKGYDFDYHIGSVHNLGDWIFDHPDRLKDWDSRDVGAVYREYFAAVREMLHWGFIDILGHLDLPKKFGHVPDGGYMDLVEELLPLIAESGVVVEVNTAGRDKPVGEFYPSPAIVGMLVRAKVPFTIGSDAHRPSEVGRHRAEAIQLLRDCGARELISFERRRRIGVRL